jgi:hypothetical protein
VDLFSTARLNSDTARNRADLGSVGCDGHDLDRKRRFMSQICDLYLVRAITVINKKRKFRMTISKRVSYSNSQLDPFGMPTDYRAYLVRGRAAMPGEANPTDGIAKVYTLSTGAIPLNPDHVVAPGGAEKAVDAAIQKLRQLNVNFAERIFDNQQP